MPTNPRFPLPQAVVFAAYMIPSFVAAIALGNAEFLFYAVVTTVLAGVVYLIHRRVGFSGGVLWLLTVWGALHMNGGLVPVPDWLPAREPRVFYNLWIVPPHYLKYDHVVHAFGFGTTAWAVFQGLRSILPGVGATVGVLLICWTAAQGFGALNEVVEFAAVLAVEETNVGDFDNAMWDLVANMLGAGVACGMIALAERREHSPVHGSTAT